MTSRLARRFLIPFAFVLVAAALGTFVMGRTRVAANSTALQNPGMRLAGNVQQSLSAQIAAGKLLFDTTCSTCHGGNAQGGTYADGNTAPSLQGVGGAEVNLWLSVGWMPLKTPESQPENRPVYFTRQQIDDLVAFVESTAPTAPGNLDNIFVDLKGANEATGADIFSLNCAPCHTITGSGDALASGVHAPGLHDVSALEVLEAIRTGPQNMPRFGPQDITPSQAQDVAAFVTRDLQHPANVGGLGLGGVGPVAEGFVGLFVGVGVCLIFAYWVGDRTDPDAYGDDEHLKHGTDEHDGDSDEHEKVSDEHGEVSDGHGGASEADDGDAGIDGSVSDADDSGDEDADSTDEDTES